MTHPLVFPRRTYFYPVGNTSPVCLTQDIAPEQSASILLLGCGDPRNIFFTLYSAAEAQNKFSRKLDITCCDVEPAVLARNILLFTLIMDTEPTLDGPLWSIFYDFYIDSSAMRLLVDQCRRLSEASTDIGVWHASKYGSLLRICAQQTLSELRRHWALYAGFENLPTRRKAAVERAFSAALKSKGKSDTYELNISSARSAGPLHLHAMHLVSDHYNRFWSSGVNTQDKKTLASATLLNPTFVYSITGEGFSVHYGTDAFSSFHLAPAFAHLEGSIDSPDTESAASLFDFVRGTFRDWCLSFKAVAERRTLILRFAAGDALAFCTLLHHRNLDRHAKSTMYATRWKANLLELDGGDYSSGAGNAAPQAFDVIETSNLTDHVGLQNILIITQPILSHTSSAVIYTETLLPASKDPINGFRELMCGEISTMSLLLDLVPSSFVSKFTTLNTAQEVASHHIYKGKGQFHERMTWKIMSLSEPNTSPSASPTISFESKALGGLLFDIYLRMFNDENMNPLMQALSGQKDVGRVHSIGNLIHNTRATFVAFARIVQNRITKDWDSAIDAFLLLVYADKALLTGSNYFQDMACQLHLQGVHSVDVLKHGPLRGRVALPGWIHTPPIVFVVFQIPRDRLKPLEDYPLEQLGTPLLQCDTQGPSFHNAFMSIQTAFGSVTNTAKSGQEPCLVFQQDDEGWNSAADLVVTFAHPAWILSIDHISTRVRFGVRSTPASVQLTATLGFELLIFDASISDERHVFLSRSHLRVSTESHQGAVYITPPTMNPPVPSAINHSSVALDGSSRQIVTFTVKATIEDPREQAVLESPTQVKVTSAQISPCRVALRFGPVERVVQFPFVVDGTRTKLRIARKSHYIEVIIPPAGHRTSGGFFVNNFPLVMQGNTPIPWNIHRLNLDKLPTVTINQRHDWFNPSISLMMSDDERQTLENGQKFTQAGSQALADLKETLHCLFVRHTGTQGGRGCSVFALQDPLVGHYAVLFISDVRLDLASHTFVLNGYLLPFSTKPSVTRALDIIFSSPICSVNTAGEETMVWRRLLPALAERCRQTWTHHATCEYIKTGKIPLSFLPEESPICSCGEGKNVEGMRKVKGWKEFAPLCTRIAISPLFAVSYMESVAGFAKRTGAKFSALLKGQQGQDATGSEDSEDMKRRGMESIQRFMEASDAVPAQKRCARCGLGGDLKVCGQCKQVSYCSPACQRQDWKKHKQQCRRA